MVDSLIYTLRLEHGSDFYHFLNLKITNFKRFILHSDNFYGIIYWPNPESSGFSYGSVEQTFSISGPTINAPPFNSVDFQGDLNTIEMLASDYKQVGAFFAQTDGMTLYPGSTISNIFYHSNDDTIKTYGSDITVSNITIWKGTTAPAVQFGWASRDLSNVVVSDINIIHSRYNSNESHPSLVGANQIYPLSEALSNTSVLTNTISDFSITNIRSEGISGNLMRICPLSNFKNFTITNASIEKFPVRSNAIFGSQLPAFTNSEGTIVGMEGFVITDFTIGGVKVSQAANNYAYDQLGGMNIPYVFLDGGGVTILWFLYIYSKSLRWLLFS